MQLFTFLYKYCCDHTFSHLYTYIGVEFHIITQSLMFLEEIVKIFHSEFIIYISTRAVWGFSFSILSHKFTNKLYSLKITFITQSCLFATPWTGACRAPLSMEFSRQEYWSGLPFPSPGDLPDPGIKPRFPTLQADSLPFESPGSPTFILVGVN